MKKWLIALILVFIIPAAHALEGQTLLERGSPETINGKTLTYTGSFQDSIYIEIDGESGVAELEKWSYLNGAYLYLNGKSKANKFREASASLNFSIEFECGDGTCSINETTSTCCTDCGCDGTKECVTNRCYDDDLVQCIEDEDCNDNNTCTIDTCFGIPPQCSLSAVTECINDDGCCAPNCNDVEDNDCFNPDCRSDSECANRTHQGSCEPPGVCVYDEKTKEEITNLKDTIQNNTVPELIPIDNSRFRTFPWEITLGVILLFFAGYGAAKFYPKKK